MIRLNIAQGQQTNGPIIFRDGERGRVGVQQHREGTPQVIIAGNGGTAVQHKIGLVTLVFNDGAFGNVRRMQKENYGGRFIASNLQNPDFVKMAESYGAQGLRADSPEALRGALRQAFATPDVQTIIDLPVGEVPSPWPIIMAPQNLLAQID